MGPTWVLSAPDGPHVVPMNLAIRLLLSHPGIPGVTLCFCTGLYAAAATARCKCSHYEIRHCTFLFNCSKGSYLFVPLVNPPIIYRTQIFSMCLWSSQWHPMSVMTSLITGNSTVCSITCSGIHQRKHQSLCHWPYVRGIHKSLVDSPHKWPVTWKVFPRHVIIMCDEFLNVMVHQQGLRWHGIHRSGLT